MKNGYGSLLRGVERMEVLYLLCEYRRRIGQAQASREYFEQVKTATYITRTGEEKTGHTFFLDLVKDREQLMDRQHQRLPSH
jgi:hypothetical protein